MAQIARDPLEFAVQVRVKTDAVVVVVVAAAALLLLRGPDVHAERDAVAFAVCLGGLGARFEEFHLNPGFLVDAVVDDQYDDERNVEADRGREEDIFYFLIHLAHVLGGGRRLPQNARQRDGQTQAPHGRDQHVNAPLGHDQVVAERTRHTDVAVDAYCQ